MNTTTDNTPIDDEDQVTFNDSDESILASQTEEGWDDLAALKDDLAVTLISFVGDVESISSSKELMEALGDKQAEFQRNLDVFYSDIDRFTNKIKELRDQHEQFTGKIKTMEELNIFTRVSMGYQTLQIELQSLLGPTMGTIVLMVHEIAPNVKVPDVTDVAVNETKE